jgi:photosystem II stability/assembly factor-like uncharacterized protein
MEALRLLEEDEPAMTTIQRSPALPAWGQGLTLSLALATCLSAQTPPDPPSASPWRLLESPVAVELRGLAAVGDGVAWASGAEGTVLRTLDGETWAVVPVPGAEAMDFRDIEAWSASQAIALSIGPGEASNVYRTTDGGASWRRVFANAEPAGFWDALAFWDREHGAVFGDPVRGRFQVYTTGDAGETWQPVPEAGMPRALEGEGAFAASGSCLAAGPEGRLAFVTGAGSVSRVFVSLDGGRRFEVSVAPVPAGAASKGLFSVAWVDADTLITVGGDYRLPALLGVKAGLSRDAGAYWSSVASAPGFLSSVTRGPGGEGSLVAVGLAGTGISRDGGATWTAIDAKPFNTAGFAPARGSATPAGWAVGPQGSLARWRGVSPPEP